MFIISAPHVILSRFFDPLDIPGDIFVIEMRDNSTIMDFLQTSYAGGTADESI
jgi:hypothetical protein